MDIGFLDSVLQSGPMGRVIVVLLFFVSIYSWAIMIYKQSAIRRARAGSDKFLAFFRERRRQILSQRALPERAALSPLGAVCDAGLAELALVDPGNPGSAPAARPLSMHQIDNLERSLERAVAEQVLKLRRHLIVLATTAGAAPFVGLFGTVWGIMKAFSGMYATGSASISSVAPGVSAALTTTVAGLAVAIPALVGYNYLINHVRHLTVQMDNFTSEFVSEAGRDYGTG